MKWYSNRAFSSIDGYKKYIILALLLSILSFSSSYYFNMTLGNKHSNHPEKFNQTINSINEDTRAKVYNLFEKNSPSQAYNLFKQEHSQEGYSVQHTAAHIFGEVLYEKVGINGIRVCDESYQFGCYHGFFSTVIAHQGINSLNSLVEACKNEWADNSRNFKICEHGIGHGILAYLGYNKLNLALDLCQKISSDNSETGCFGGVFMEFNFRTMVDPSGSGVFSRTIPETDPNDPCDKLSQIYQPACYYSQASLWVQLYKQDFKHVSTLCSNLQNDQNKASCLSGLGGSIASHTSYEVSTISQVCQSLATSQEKDTCFTNTAVTLYFIPNYTNNASTLCDKLKSPNLEKCLSLLH